jgi:hypothetical protein
MNQEDRSTALRPRASAATFCVLLPILLSGCFFFGPHGPKNASTAAVVAPPAKVKPIVRPAPDFIWVGAGNKGVALKALRGQPVVLIIAPSPDQGEFRKQVSRIDSLYLDLSERKAVFMVAFTAQGGRVPSNVPYAIAADGPAVAKAYGVPPGGFAVAVISPDGNMDLFSTQVEAAQRLLDVINNSYQPQAAARTGLGS